jgi:GntR family transcriptional regulator
MDQIRYQIAAEILKPGAQLPSARQLAQDLAVNANTVLKVYRELGMEHLVRVDRGKGTFVAETNVQLRKSERKRIVGDLLGEAIAKGMQFGLSFAELRGMLEDEHIKRSGGDKGV